jgi:hypothetical protein
MAFFRALVFLLLVASLLCFAMYVGTGQLRWRAIGLRILKWTLIAAMGFFAVLILERIPIPL